MTTPRPDPSDELRILHEHLTAPTHVLPRDATLDDVVEAFARDARSHTACLVTETGHLDGVVTFRRLRKALHPRHGAGFPGLAGLVQRAWRAPIRTAMDCATRAPGVTLRTPIHDALFRMDVHHLADLPVVDASGRLLLELKHDAHARLLQSLEWRGARAQLPRRDAAAPRVTPTIR